MIVKILGPYTGGESGGQILDNAIRPLFSEVFGISSTDDTDRPISGVVPGVNLVMVAAELSGPQFAQVAQDNRFIVLPPNANTKAAVRAFITAAGGLLDIPDSDSNAQMGDRIRAYLRGL